jgi:hypothetical protein
MPFGQTPGCSHRNRVGIGDVLAVGLFIALIAIPQSPLFYAMRNLNPWAACRRYRLTNRGVDAAIDRLGGAWRLFL